MNKPDLDFDLTFRPDYWAPSDPISLIIANVKGEARRQMIVDVLEGRHQMLPPGAELTEEVLADTLSPEDRTARSGIHPHLMGGEYLPDYRRGEIEIARIVVATDMTEVVSVRARRSRDLRIHYRVVDEYDTTFVHRPHSSKAPLTFAQLVSLLDSIRVARDQPGHEFVTWCRDCSYDRGSDDPARYSHLVTVRSASYPQLEAFYCWRNDQWLANELAATAARSGGPETDARRAAKVSAPHVSAGGEVFPRPDLVPATRSPDGTVTLHPEQLVVTPVDASLFELITLGDQYVNKTCVVCGFHAALFVCAGRFVSLCPFCAVGRIEEYREIGNDAVEPDWVTVLYREAKKEAAFQARKEDEAYTVAFDDLLKCARCGALIQLGGARYYHAPGQATSPPYCEACADTLRTGEGTGS